MKQELTVVPWDHVKDLAYGDWDFVLTPFLSWLAGVKTKVIALPVPQTEAASIWRTPAVSSKSMHGLVGSLC